ECAVLLRLDDPSEPDGMRLGHRRPDDQNRVRVDEILLRRRRAAAPERGAQTGHRGAMSYPGLVADRHHPQAAAEELLDQVVLFVVERRTAEVGHVGALHERQGGW